MESSLPVELVPNLNRIAHGIELELELMQKNHENPSPDSNPSLELIQPYSRHWLPLRHTWLGEVQCRRRILKQGNLPGKNRGRNLMD